MNHHGFSDFPVCLATVTHPPILQGDYPNQLDFQSKTCVAECPQNGGEVVTLPRSRMMCEPW